jgi:hypothetical protein
MAFHVERTLSTLRCVLACTGDADMSFNVLHFRFFDTDFEENFRSKFSETDYQISV